MPITAPHRPRLEPGFALRALCMFRFVHPRTDLRVAGGREVPHHGQSHQPETHESDAHGRSFT